MGQNSTMEILHLICIIISTISCIAKDDSCNTEDIFDIRNQREAKKFLTVNPTDGTVMLAGKRKINDDSDEVVDEQKWRWRHCGDGGCCIVNVATEGFLTLTQEKGVLPIMTTNPTSGSPWKYNSETGLLQDLNTKRWAKSLQSARVNDVRMMTKPKYDDGTQNAVKYFKWIMKNYNKATTPAQ